jgi:hypothetical protein
MRNQMHDKASLAAALQLQLALNPTEAQIAMRLTTQGCVAREQICAIGTCGHRSVKAGSVGAIVRGLRRKLAVYGIAIAGINGFGWELRQKDREKIIALIGPRGSGRASAKAASVKINQPINYEPKERQDRSAAA